MAITVVGEMTPSPLVVTDLLLEHAGSIFRAIQGLPLKTNYQRRLNAFWRAKAGSPVFCAGRNEIRFVDC